MSVVIAHPCENVIVGDSEGVALIPSLDADPALDGSSSLHQLVAVPGENEHPVSFPPRTLLEVIFHF